MDVLSSRTADGLACHLISQVSSRTLPQEALVPRAGTPETYLPPVGGESDEEGVRNASEVGDNVRPSLIPLSPRHLMRTKTANLQSGDVSPVSTGHRDAAAAVDLWKPLRSSVA
ncbi:unnamed protein product [Lota lota]